MTLERIRRRRRSVPGLSVLLLVAVGLVVLAGCGSADSGNERTDGPAATGSAATPDADETLFPDVVAVEITPLGGDEFDVATTLSSPYDSPERYADAWRVLDEDGNELGVRELTHDHASEQPFTRSQTVTIPADVAEITVEGRDQISGYGGETQTVAVPGRT